MLCDFHQQQVEEQWLATTINSMKNVKEIVRTLLINITEACVEA